MSNITNLKYKDGEDEDILIENIKIETVSNGYVIRFTYDDEEEVVEVYSRKDGKDMMKSISEALGL